MQFDSPSTVKADAQDQPQDKDRQIHEKFLADAGMMVPNHSKEVVEIVKQFGSSKFAEREKASKNLEKLGFSALPHLKEALSSKDAEVRTRTESFVLNLLKQHGGSSFSTWKDRGYKLSECPKWLNNLDDLIKNGAKGRTDQLTLLRDTLKNSPSLSKEYGADIDGLSQQIEEENFPKIKQELEQIRELKLSSFAETADETAKITDDSLKILQSMKNLRSLDLTGAHQVTDKGLENLKNLTNLKVVELSDSQATDDSVKYLNKSAGSLRELALGRTQITDQSLIHLAQQFPNLESLTVYDTNITDKGVAELAKLSNLESLSLAITNITDVGISKLTGLTNLKALYLSETKVTKDGVDNFKKVPNCKIFSTWGQPS
jgi:Leucine-rich repeat (LRR) protein